MGKRISFCGGLIVAAALSLASTSANAQSCSGPGTASFNDLSGVTVLSCYGFYSGNVLSGNATNTALIQSVLGNFPLDPNYSYTSAGWLEKIDDNNGSTTVDFNYLLTGPTVVGIHFGGPEGGKTGFYYFNAGPVGVDSFTLNLSRSSGVALFTTAVPEPEIYAMLALGLGVIGWAARRKNMNTGHPA